ncbi:MAG: 4-carboxymuconolactone decarboxylase [SAR324 cluster bacterium]|nr:4-carboxymuconolactone decarboxylase [SAR324 cluster bacterium]
MDDRQRYDEGMKVRRAALGDAYVEGSLARRTEFNVEFQDFITRYAWGEIWTRPGFDRRTRSLLTLAMMMALGREAEFRIHVRAASNNGVSQDDLKELFLQAAIYCGVPAANSAFATAAEVFAEMEQETKGG